MMNTFLQKHRCSVTVTLFLFLLPAVAVPASAFDADADFMYATGLFQKKRFQYAADAFDEFLKQYPTHPRSGLARLYFGLSLNSLEKYAPARDQFEAFVKENTDSRNLADAKYRIGECSFYLKEYDKAIPQLNEYLTSHKGHGLNSWASLMLGESNNAINEWVTAESILRPLVETAPTSNIVADCTFALASSLQGQKKSPEAIQLYQKVVDLKSASLSHRALARIGTIHFENSAYAEAATAYDALIAEYGESTAIPAASLQSGIARYRLGQFVEALARLEKVPSDSSVAAQTAMWKGLCRRELGELDLARQELALALTAAGDTPLAAEVMFNRAQIEVLDQKKDVAAQMFVDLAARWPGDRHVPDCLFNAAELNMELGDLPESRRIFDRLNSDFPDEKSKPRTVLLDGRILLSEGKTAEAVTALRSVAALDSVNEREKLLRSYHLIRALHRSKLFQDAVAVYEPLHPSFASDAAADLLGAIALAAVSCLETQQFAKAQMYADEFLKLDQNPMNAADALATRAVASSHLKEFDTTKKDLDRLTKEFSENAQTWMAVLQSAEAAWQQEDFAVAAEIFGIAVQRKTDPKLHLSALSGAAWSHYKLGQFQQATILFHDAHTSYPNSEAAIEAKYMEAASLLEQDQAAEAAVLFSSVFETFDQKAVEDPELLKNEYFLDAGRMQARILSSAGDVAGADGLWERVAKRFDAAPILDEILDEWAYLNLQNKKFQRSDEIYGRLLDRFPQSKFAGQARLSLAESEMQARRLDVALREFIAIAMSDQYAETEREAALYHAIDIQAAQRNWPDVIRHSEIFAEKYSASDLAPNVQLLHAEGLLDQQMLEQSKEKLMSLREVILGGQLAADPWTERIWVALAEVALAQQQYADVDKIAAELEERSPLSRFLFQMRDVQGRRWKSQAEPDFAKAREYFDQVINSEVGRGTETAARCQFLTAETLLLEGNTAAALKEYYRVYLSYAYDDWRARGLFQAAGCEAKLNNFDAAARSYNDVIKDFPASDLAATAKQKLTELAAKKPNVAD